MSITSPPVDFSGALADLDEALARNHSNAEWYLERGLCHLLLGAEEKATPDIDRAVRLGLDPRMAQRQADAVRKLRDRQKG